MTGISSAAGSVSYAYDAIGRRVSREDASGVTHSFIYDGSALVGEYNQSTGVWDTEYTYGLGLIDKQGSSGTEYELYNGLGDVYQSLNSAGSLVLSGEVCDDFGQHFGSSGTLGTDDLSYKWRGASGYRWDNDGLWAGDHNEPIVEVGARYYIPAMGVFLTRDTDLSQRPYEYCNGDPVNAVDPSGHSAMGTELASLSGIIEMLMQADAINLSQYTTSVPPIVFSKTTSTTTTTGGSITEGVTLSATSGNIISTISVNGNSGSIVFQDTVTTIVAEGFTTSYSTLSTVGLKLGIGSGGSFMIGVTDGSNTTITVGGTLIVRF